MKLHNDKMFRITSLCLTILFLGLLSVSVTHAGSNTYTLQVGQHFDLGHGYYLEDKQNDVAGKKVWFELIYDDPYYGEYVTDGKIFSVGETWTLNDVNNNPFQQVTVDNEYYVGDESTVQVTFSQPILPNAKFIASPTSGIVPLRVTFNDTSTGSPTSWSWNFGDNNTSTEQNPIHTYYTIGNYNVTLTASNANGRDLNSTTISVSTFNFTSNVTEGIAPLCVQFNDTSNIYVPYVDRLWDFGDGNTSSDKNPVHTYYNTGNYTVGLYEEYLGVHYYKNHTINVSQPFRPNPNGYHFKNADIPFTIHSVDDFKNTYNIDINANNKWIKPKAWFFYENCFANTSINGNCFGFSATSLVLYNKGYYNTFSNNTSDSIPSAWKTYMINFNQYPNNTQEWIQNYSTLQCTNATLDEGINLKGPEKVYDTLKEHLLNGKTDMVLTIQGTFGGTLNSSHAVVPYKFIENSDNSANIYVYDCNYPNYTGAFLQMNKTKVISSNIGFTQIDTVYLTSVNAFNQKPEIPSWIYLIYTRTHFKFTGSDGKILGYDEGVYKDEINDALRIIPAGDTNDSSSLEAYYVPDPSIKIELIGNKSGNSESSIITPSGLITLYMPVTPTSVAQLKVLNNGTGIEYTPENGTAPALDLMLDVETSNNAQIVNANISQIELGGSVNLSNINGNITLKNIGLSRTCNISIEQSKNNQNFSTFIDNVVIEGNSTVHVVPSNWNDLSSSIITITNVGDNGTVYYTKIIRPEASFSITESVVNPDPNGDCILNNPGDKVPYRIVVKNEGNATLTNVTVHDSLIPLLIGPTGDNNSDNILNSNETWVYNGTYSLTQSDVNKGYIINNVTVMCDQLPAKNTSLVTQILNNRGLQVYKSVTGLDVAGNNVIDRPGDVVNYQVAIQNTGNTNLTGISVSDPMITLTKSGDTALNSLVLRPGEAWVYKGNYTITQSDIVNATTGGRAIITNTVTVRCDQLPDENSSIDVQIVPTVNAQADINNVSNNTSENGSNSNPPTANVTQTTSSTGGGSSGGSSGGSVGHATVVSSGSSPANKSTSENMTATVNVTQPETNPPNSEQSSTSTTFKTVVQKATSTPAKESKKTPGFEIISGITALLGAIYLYRRR